MRSNVKVCCLPDRAAMIISAMSMLVVAQLSNRAAMMILMMSTTLTVMASSTSALTVIDNNIPLTAPNTSPIHILGPLLGQQSVGLSEQKVLPFMEIATTNAHSYGTLFPFTAAGDGNCSNSFTMLDDNINIHDDTTTTTSTISDIPSLPGCDSVAAWCCW